MHFCVSVFHKAVLSQKHYSYMALENKASFDGNTSAKISKSDYVCQTYSKRFKDMHSVQFYVWHTALLNNATITVAMARIGALIGLFKVHVVTFYMCRQGQLGYIFCAFFRIRYTRYY